MALGSATNIFVVTVGKYETFEAAKIGARHFKEKGFGAGFDLTEATMSLPYFSKSLYFLHRELDPAVIKGIRGNMDPIPTRLRRCRSPG